MKKLISILLAVSLMAMSTMASAASTALKAGGQRNSGSAANNSGNSDYLRDYKNIPFQLALYRPGDTLTFSNDTEKMSKGDVITFISSKVDATDYTDATVMFIDQVTAESDSPSYSYKIREDLAEGIYKLEIKIGSADVKTFYYSVADPKVEILSLDAAGNKKHLYSAETKTAQYFAAITYGLAGSNLDQAGVAEFGFKFKAGEKGTATATMPISAYDGCYATNETDAATFVFTVAVTDVEENNIPVAEGTIIDE
jgi:hypothetical protein